MYVENGCIKFHFNPEENDILCGIIKPTKI